MAWDDFVDSLRFKLALENDRKKVKAITDAATHAYAADLGLTGDQMKTYAQVAASYNAAKGGMYAQDIEGRARMGAAQLASDAGKFTPIADPIANRGGILNTKTGVTNWFKDTPIKKPAKEVSGAAQPGGIYSQVFPETGNALTDITDQYNRAAIFNQRREQEQSPFNRFLRRISKPLSYYEPAF